jgi:hypothetical protein
MCGNNASNLTRPGTVTEFEVLIAGIVGCNALKCQGSPVLQGVTAWKSVLFADTVDFVNKAKLH